MCLGKISGPISARTVFYLLSLSGFIVSYMLRTDMNVAIVAMVRQNLNQKNHNDTVEYSVCFGKVQNVNGTKKAFVSVFDEDLENQTSSETIPTSEALQDPLPDTAGSFVDWNINEQSYVLASFYWLYVISQVLGAVLTQRWGMKRVFGYAHLLTAFCSYLLPVSSITHLGLAILIRSIQGFLLGLTWPAMFAGQQYWIPKSDRACFLTSFQGYNLGIGITYPICGFIITYWGWEAIFYTTGTIGVIWCAFFYVFVYDSPDLHPRISNEERQYIKANTETLSYEDSRKQRIPWLQIVTNRPVLVIGAACFGWIWVNYVFVIAGPTFIKSVLGFNIGHSGILSGLPFLISFPMGFLLHYIADKIIKLKLLKPISVRKLFTALATVLPGIMCLAMSQLECESTGVLICMLIAVSFPAAIFAGCIPNIVAIAPEFGGPAIAVIQTIYMSASFLSPLVTGYLTQDGHNIQVWKNVFYVAAAVAFVTYIPYLIWATDQGVTWPAMFSLMTSWVPVMERTRFMSVVQGKNLGVGLTYPLCGYIITYLGWKSVFYATGTIGITWSFLWYLLVYNSPESHPRISIEERQYIKQHRANVLNNNCDKKEENVPWISIITSLSVWCIIISAFGWYWVNFMFIIGGPTYLSHVQGFNIRESGVLAGTPYLVSMPVTFIFCYLADKIISRKYLSVTNTRKSFTCVGQVVPGTLLIVIGYLGCNTQAVMIVWFIAIIMPTAMFAGTMTNMTDLAPSYAGYVVAFSQTIYLLASFISPLATGYFTRDGNTVGAWQIVFNVSAGFTITSFVIYAFWGTAEVQSWNYGSKSSCEQENMLHNSKQEETLSVMNFCEMRRKSNISVL